jgi:hypothetical protein
MGRTPHTVRGLASICAVRLSKHTGEKPDVSPATRAVAHGSSYYSQKCQTFEAAQQQGPCVVSFPATMARRTTRMHGKLTGTRAFSRLSFPSTRLLLNWGLMVVLGGNISGCVSAIALDRAVIAYDKAATELVAKQLLLNIARARYDQPMHFTPYLTLPQRTISLSARARRRR